MKKILLASLVAFTPVIASAQVQQLSGFNFGQFIFAGAPSVDTEAGVSTGFIQSNFGLGTTPGPLDSGVYKINNFAGSPTTPYSAGLSTLYFDGTNGSSAFDFANGTNVSVFEVGAGVAVNNQTVNPTISMLLAGDDNNATLNFVSSGATNKFSIVTNTTGFADFNPASFSQPNDFNFTFFFNLEKII
jgi:hypothetical protein